MRKKYLIYCLIVILAIVSFNAILSMNFYSTDGYYFWGLAKYIEAGKLENSKAFWTLYPAGFSFILSIVRIILPWLTYNELSLVMLIGIFCIGPWIIHKSFKKLKFWECVSVFLFSVGGFYIAIYYIQVIVAAQIIGYLVLPIFPALFFSDRKRDLYLAIVFLILLYLIHSMTAFLIVLTTAFSAFFSANRKRAKYLFIAALPLMLIKLSHILLINIYPSENYSWLPLNSILSKVGLQTSFKHFNSVLAIFVPYEFLLSGIPLFFWILIFGFKKTVRKIPAFNWYFTLFTVCGLITIFFKNWDFLFTISWVKDRYFSFMWLAIVFSLPYVYKEFKPREKLLFKVATSIFILFGVGTGFWRPTRVESASADLITWIKGMSVFVDEQDGPIAFLFGPDGIPYAYSIFAPHDIFFLFPVHEPKEWFVNLKNPNAGFYSKLPNSTDIEALMLEYNISFIVYGKEFSEEFANLKNSKHYSLVSNYKDEAFAYDLNK